MLETIYTPSDEIERSSDIKVILEIKECVKGYYPNNVVYMFVFNLLIVQKCSESVHFKTNTEAY
jgi:hypothetical protein